MGSDRRDGFCRLTCSTNAVAPTLGSFSLNFGSTYVSSSTVFTPERRKVLARAVRITLDPMGVSPRKLRVYYSQDWDFSNLALAVDITAPAKLQSALNATVGFAATSVRACCCACWLYCFAASCWCCTGFLP